jgi:Beta-galactosidase/beta-glucuronidase
MKKELIVIVFLIGFFPLFSQYVPAGDRIKTEWASQVSPDNVLPEYPRPIMVRQQWQNLNGLWDYAILPKGGRVPQTFDGQILVPFCIESSLSGVQKEVGKDNELWYRREFTVPSSWKGQRILLHFGAVDWKADVWVNGVKVGSHTGGYAPFTFDMTQALNSKGTNAISVRVWDPSDKSYQPRGKQVSKPGGIFYTSVTGIWQTVWMEPVNEVYFQDIKTVPDIDNNMVTVWAKLSDQSSNDLLEVLVTENGKTIASGRACNGEPVDVMMPEKYKLWSPDAPNLYDIKVSLIRNGKTLDVVDSYFAMRKISVGLDENGITRIELNNEPVFHFGLLDQGWWPDGLYTAPTDMALRYDIEKTKDLGFNMIRKHVKVEPARWYYHCDLLGMMVWQDMPSGGRGPGWRPDRYFDGAESLRSPESESCYRKEWQEIIDYLYSQPCVCVWVPFNESWGQFKTTEIVAWTKQYDPSRLVNPASGGNHFPCGDILDLHNYPEPKLYFYDASRATVLGEYGGIGRKIDGHTWDKDQGWGYVEFDTEEKVTDKYVEYANMLYDLISRGFSAGVYTQTTDCEVELNGLMTYDRKVMKLDEERVRAVNTKICHAL